MTGPVGAALQLNGAIRGGDALEGGTSALRFTDVWRRRLTTWIWWPHWTSGAAAWIGWAIAGRFSTGLALDALRMVPWRRRPELVLHHSDRRTQYAALVFGRCCEGAGFARPPGSVGDGYRNAMCESFFATLESDILDRSAGRLEPVRDPHPARQFITGSRLLDPPSGPHGCWGIRGA